MAFAKGFSTTHYLRTQGFQATSTKSVSRATPSLKDSEPSPSNSNLADLGVYNLKMLQAAARGEYRPNQQSAEPVERINFLAW